MEEDGLEKGLLIPKMNPLLKQQFKLSSQGKASKGDAIGGGSQMIRLIIWLLITNIKFTLMSPGEWKDRSGILERPIRLAVPDWGSG